MKKFAITRRDFLNGVLLAGAGAMVSPLDLLAAQTQSGSQIIYPPALMGLRGSQPGSYDAAHTMALSPEKDFGDLTGPVEQYDLIVIGAGVSGLAAAHYYRTTVNPNARILILDNHDDFGGHARRDEFTIAGQTYITYGGSQSFDTPSEYSAVALKLLSDLGIDINKLGAAYDQDFFQHYSLSSGIFFDAATFGKAVLLQSGLPDYHPVDGYSRELMGGLPAPQDFISGMEKMPFTESQRAQLREILSVPQKAEAFFQGPDGEDKFWATSYIQFLQQVYGLQDPALLKLLSLPDAEDNALVGNMISLEEAVDSRLFGLPPRKFFRQWLGKAEKEAPDNYIYHFPDGNATVARLLAHRLMPNLANISDAKSSIASRFDYAQLDVPGQPVRLRLNSTAILAENTSDGTRVQYVQKDTLREASARHTVMAGWHIMAAYIIPDLPERQKAAMHANIKLPLIYTQVALRQWRPIQRSGVAYAYCPGSYFQFVETDFPIGFGGFQPDRSPDNPMSLLMIRLPPPLFAKGTVSDLAKLGCQEIMVTTLDQYEQQIRAQLSAMFGPHGFNEADIAGITVNRWPHGYVWDGAEFEGKPAHRLARQPHGKIAFANSDSTGNAYLDDAIDAAWQAVSYLKQTT